MFVVQETTAAFLTAALASGTSEISSPEQVISGTNVSTPLTDDHTLSRDAEQPSHSETTEDKNFNEDTSKVILFLALAIICANCFLLALNCIHVFLWTGDKFQE